MKKMDGSDFLDFLAEELVGLFNRKMASTVEGRRKRANWVDWDQDDWNAEYWWRDGVVDGIYYIAGLLFGDAEGEFKEEIYKFHQEVLCDWNEWESCGKHQSPPCADERFAALRKELRKELRKIQHLAKEKIDPVTKDSSIYDLDLDGRSERRLRQTGIETVGQLLSAGKYKIREIAGLGDNSISWIEDALSDHGLSFDGKDDDDEEG